MVFHRGKKRKLRFDLMQGTPMLKVRKRRTPLATKALEPTPLRPLSIHDSDNCVTVVTAVRAVMVMTVVPGTVTTSMLTTTATRDPAPPALWTLLHVSYI